MFDFFKKKSYTVTQENGMEKLVTAADINKAAEEALKALEALPENYIKDLIDYTKSSIDHGNISKEFLKMIVKIVDAVSTKKAKEVQKSLDDETSVPKPKEEKKEEPKKEESKEEPKKDDTLDLGGDLGKVANINKESIVRSAADTNPASSKYRAEGIKEKLLEINKEVCNNCGRCVGKCPFDAIEDGKYGFKIYIGGRWGKKVAHGEALSKVFTSEEEMLKVVEKAILLFREQGQTGERFADTIARIGFAEVEKQLLADDLLARKQEIIDAKLHLTGGATC